MMGHHTLQRTTIDPGELRGARHVPASPLENRTHVEALKLLAPLRPRVFQGKIEGQQRFEGRRNRESARSRSGALSLPAQRNRALNEVAQLADVARPRAREQGRREWL